MGAVVPAEAADGQQQQLNSSQLMTNKEGEEVALKIRYLDVEIGWPDFFS